MMEDESCLMIELILIKAQHKPQLLLIFCITVLSQVYSCCSVHLVELIKVGGAGGLNSLPLSLSINTYLSLNIACIMTVCLKVYVWGKGKKVFPVDISNLYFDLM